MSCYYLGPCRSENYRSKFFCYHQCDGFFVALVKATQAHWRDEDFHLHGNGTWALVSPHQVNYFAFAKTVARA
eukprot:1772536-Ditylum_brightwellii.AAC.1